MQVLDPRSRYPAVERLALAARPADTSTARYLLIQTMPPGSGLEAPMATVEGMLRRRFPRSQVVRLLRRDFMVDDPAERGEIRERCDAAILFVGPAATMVHVSWTYGSALERAGLPVTMALFDGIQKVAAHCATTKASALRSAFMPSHVHDSRGMNGFADAIIDALLGPLTADERRGGMMESREEGRYAPIASYEEMQRLFLDRGWSDGLPIHPPTEVAVEAMLSGTSLSPSQVVTTSMRPEGLTVTVEMVAITATGCPLGFPQRR